MLKFESQGWNLDLRARIWVLRREGGTQEREKFSHMRKHRSLAPLGLLPKKLRFQRKQPQNLIIQGPSEDPWRGPQGPCLATWPHFMFYYLVSFNQDQPQEVTKKTSCTIINLAFVLVMPRSTSKRGGILSPSFYSYLVLLH